MIPRSLALTDYAIVLVIFNTRDFNESIENHNKWLTTSMPPLCHWGHSFLHGLPKCWSALRMAPGHLQQVSDENGELMQDTRVCKIDGSVRPLAMIRFVCNRFRNTVYWNQYHLCYAYSVCVFWVFTTFFYLGFINSLAYVVSIVQTMCVSYATACKHTSSATCH